MFGCCCGCAPLVADEWVNVTRVHDYSDPPNPDGRSPYSRAWNVIGSDGSCTLAASTDPPTCGDPGLAVCYDTGFDGTPVGPGYVPGVLPCPTGSTGTGPVSVVGQNCYQKTGQTVSIPRSGENCGLGWKGVQAYAAWPGRFGFIRSGGACCGGPTADECTGLEDSKYLTIANFVRATYTRTEQVFYAGTWLTENCAHDWTQTASTDPYGNVTRQARSPPTCAWTTARITPGRTPRAISADTAATTGPLPRKAIRREQLLNFPWPIRICSTSYPIRLSRAVP